MHLISESISPTNPTLANGNHEPKPPQSFVWRGKIYKIAQILESSRSLSTPKRGEEPGYIRKYNFKIQTTTSDVMTLYFDKATNKWWLYATY